MYFDSDGEIRGILANENTELGNFVAGVDFELMEYTCFTDTHGKRMCEDDIVIRNGNPRFRYRVIFSESHGRWALRSLFHVKGGRPGYIALSRKPERCEVIGNVWANPELVKVEGVFD